MVELQYYLDRLLVWLNQSLPIYWLVAAIAIALIVLIVSNVRSKKRIAHLDANRQTLEIAKATNEQQIEVISRNNLSLTEKVESNSQLLAQLMADKAELKSSRDEKVQQLVANENERLGLREMVDNSNRKVSRLEADMRERNAKLQAEYEKLTELKAQFEQQKGQLKTEFKVVSEEIIKERQAMLTEQNKEGVGALLKPLKDQIDGFQKRVNEVHDESVRGNTHLKSQIDTVMQMGIKMSDEASNLTTALKGKSQQRGAWGEAQLERTLQMSGLLEHDHYEKQSSFLDDEGKRKQTDYLIKLPDDKCIVIDSKVSLNAYEKAATSEVDQYDKAMTAHVSAVRTHIKDLSSKEYSNLNGVHSPDFVLMFMPIEPAYIEAMKHDRDLFAYGYERNVILVSHTTLIPILRTVANLWTLERSNKEARLIGDRASEIYDSVALVSERLEKLGRTLNTVSGHYNDTIKAISGKQGLQGKVERFSELSSKANKTMPELSDKQLEFDTKNLQAESLDPPKLEISEQVSQDQDKADK